MGSRKSQFLGHVFEGAFKLGFLKGKIEDYDEFRREGVFDYIAQKYEDLEDLILAWRKLEEKVLDGLEDIRNLGLKYTEENLLYFLFLVGFYEGSFFGEGFKNLHLVKYIIGEDSDEAGRYQNADLMFISDKTLYVVDLKLGGAQHRSKYILDSSEDLIPFRVPGVPVNLSLGEMSLGGFLNSLLKLEDELLNLQNVNPEIKGFLQTLSYAVDYLCEEECGEKVSEVNVSIFYPLAEPFSARFYWKGEKLYEYKERIRNIYEKLKNRQWAYSVVENGTLIRNERLFWETSEKIEKLNESIKRIEENEYTIETDSINLAREDVGKRLDEFFKKEDRVKVICLFHSAGSGKTTQTREAILKMEGNHIVLYIATRKVLLRREYEELSNRNIAVVYEERQSKDSKLVENVGDKFFDLNSSPGILKRTVEKIRELAGKERIIWALCTQQAITTTERNQSTSLHLGNLATPRIINNYTFHIILDEFLGYSNGLFVIEEMFKFLKSVKERGGKANLYLFDANGYTPSILKKLLEEYAEFKVIPDSIMICDYKENDEFEHNGINVFVHAKHGYPSPKIILKKKFIQMTGSNKVEIIERVTREMTDYIKSTIQKNNTSFVYVQHKEMLSKLKHELEKEGFSTVVATTHSRKSQEMINKGNEDIILATSALSRGIDLSRPHKPVNQIYVVIHSWGIENNLVELIQTISRARGDGKTEEAPKEIHLIYSLFIFDWNIDSILEYIDEEVDKELIRLLLQKQVLEQMLELDYVVSQIIKQFVKNSEKANTVLVPFPKQYRTRYIPNQVADFEELINFIENIHQLTDHKDLERLCENLLKALSVYVVNIDFKNSHSYYHPYILFERQEVRSSFDDTLRGKIYALFKEVESILKEHNEEKTKLLKDFISNSLPLTSKEMPVLIPVYSYVLTKHFLKNGEKKKFCINKTVGRGGADSMMGNVKPFTICLNNENLGKEYACIPMTEDYPYKEVLSGRFAKFPIEFLRRLLNE